MIASTTGLDELLNILDMQIGEKKARVAAVLDEIVELKLRRERVAGALREVVGVVPTEAKSANEEGTATTTVPGRAAALIVDALRAAGKEGLAGGELNKKVQDAGLSLAAADKAKGRLKHSGAVTLEGGRWRLAANWKKAA